MIAITAALAFGSALAFAVLIIFFQHARSERDGFASIEEAAIADPTLDSAAKIALRLKIAEARSAATPWYHRAISAMGVIGFVAALVAVITQAFQNAALEQKSTIDDRQISIVRSQSERAERLLSPIVESVVNTFDRQGVSPSTEEKELLRFAVDRWLSEPPSETPAYKENMLKAFHAALLSNEYAEAVQISDRLGPNISQANPVEQASVIEYLFVSGFESATAPKIQRLLKTPGNMPTRSQLRIVAIASAIGLIGNREATLRAAQILRTDQAAAAIPLARIGTSLRQEREGLIRTLTKRRCQPD